MNTGTINEVVEHEQYQGYEQCKTAEYEDMTSEYQSEYYQMNGTKLVRNPSVCICMYLCTCIIIRMLDTQKYNILWNWIMAGKFVNIPRLDLLYHNSFLLVLEAQPPNS